MDFARISRESKPIELTEWKKLIDELEFLEQAPARSGTNPFTKEVVTASNEGVAFVTRKSRRIGNAALEEGEILTTGVPMDLCEQIAQHLGASVVEDDRS